MNNIETIEKQFAYLRQRGCKGELTLESHTLTEKEATILKDKGYKVIKVETGFLKKKIYYTITQYPSVLGGR